MPVRIAVEPGDEHHHAGEFVQVAISIMSSSTQSALLVPETALTQNETGRWTVFVEIESGHFKQTTVRRGEARGG